MPLEPEVTVEYTQTVSYEDIASDEQSIASARKIFYHGISISQPSTKIVPSTSMRSIRNGIGRRDNAGKQFANWRLDFGHWVYGLVM